MQPDITANHRRRLMGGVGVSSAPSGERDEKCTQAGMDTVKLELETF